MADSDAPGSATRSVHAGQEPDPTTGARAPPIHQTTSYVFDDPDHAARLFGLEDPADILADLDRATDRVPA